MIYRILSCFIAGMGRYGDVYVNNGLEYGRSKNQVSKL